jgi:hypothetical protein
LENRSDQEEDDLLLAFGDTDSTTLHPTDRFGLCSRETGHNHAEQTENNEYPICESSDANSNQHKKFGVPIEYVIVHRPKPGRLASCSRNRTVQHVDTSCENKAKCTQ